MQTSKLALVIMGLLILVSSSVDAAGFEFRLGPIDLYLNDDSNFRRNTVLDDPVCRAIAKRQLLEMIIEESNRVSKEELKITTRRIRMEPYLLGTSKKGEVVLKGTIVNQVVIREVVIKENDPLYQSQSQKDSTANKGFFTGWLKSSSANDQGKSKDPSGVETVELRKVTNINIIEGSVFNAPYDVNYLYQGDIADVICGIAPRLQK